MQQIQLKEIVEQWHRKSLVQQDALQNVLFSFLYALDNPITEVKQLKSLTNIVNIIQQEAKELNQQLLLLRQTMIAYEEMVPSRRQMAEHTMQQMKRAELLQQEILKWDQVKLTQPGVIEPALVQLEQIATHVGEQQSLLDSLNEFVRERMPKCWSSYQEQYEDYVPVYEQLTKQYHQLKKKWDNAKDTNLFLGPVYRFERALETYNAEVRAQKNKFHEIDNTYKVLKHTIDAIEKKMNRLLKEMQETLQQQVEQSIEAYHVANEALQGKFQFSFQQSEQVFVKRDEVLSHIEFAKRCLKTMKQSDNVLYQYNEKTLQEMQQMLQTSLNIQQVQQLTTSLKSTFNPKTVSMSIVINVPSFEHAEHKKITVELESFKERLRRRKSKFSTMGVLVSIFIIGTVLLYDQNRMSAVMHEWGLIDASKDIDSYESGADDESYSEDDYSYSDNKEVYWSADDAAQFVQYFRDQYLLALNERHFGYITDLLTGSAYAELEQYVGDLQPGYEFTFYDNDITSVEDLGNNQFYVYTFETFDFTNHLGETTYYERYKQYVVYGSDKLVIDAIHITETQKY